RAYLSLFSLLRRHWRLNCGSCCKAIVGLCSREISWPRRGSPVICNGEPANQILRDRIGTLSVSSVECVARGLSPHRVIGVRRHHRSPARGASIPRVADGAPV